MAKILLIHGTNGAASQGDLAALGHEVTATIATTAAGLDAAWGTGHDVIVLMATTSTGSYPWVSAKWSAGVPVLFGNFRSGEFYAPRFGVATSEAESYATGLTVNILAAHPVTSGYTGAVAVTTGAHYSSHLPTTADPRGVALADLPTNAQRVHLLAIDKGTPLHPATNTPAGGVAPARAVYLGWLARDHVATAAGRAILGNAVTWALNAAPPKPKARAVLTATTGGAVTLTRARRAASTLTATTGGQVTLRGQAAASSHMTVTTGGSVTLDATVPGVAAAAAHLAVTTGGTVDLAATHHASVTLTATTGGSATLAGDETTARAALVVTTDGTATLERVAGQIYAAATLAVTTGGTLTLDAQATTRAHLTVTTGGSVWLTREWTRDPITGRGAYQLAVTDRTGDVLCHLSTSYLSQPIVERLNDVDGTGSGTDFSVPDSDLVAHATLRQYRELQVARGGHHLGTYVLLNPDDTATAGDVPWQARGLGHYLTKRRVGPAHRRGLLPKKWRGGYREGSIPAVAPKWSRVGEPAQVGPGLRVEGSTHVQQTVTRLGSDTTFAFGSFTLTSSGQAALREFAKTIEVDTDPDDLQDIAAPTITIIGHTDSVPYYDHPGGNQWLSEQRANAVRAFLADLVPEGTTLVASGRGATQPVASNATDSGRAQNRRVDLTYPKTVEARGHRQFVEDRFLYTNPSRHIKRNLTFSSWWQLESYKEPNADGSVIWIGRRPVGGDDASWVEYDWTDIDHETPLGTWTRSEVNITVPADGKQWEIVARLTPPAGTIVYDEGATDVYADDALEFIDVDQADIVAALVRHAQDPAFDKDDLGITVRATKTGVKRTRVYYWHDRQTIASCLEELLNISDGLDVTWETTPTRRTLVTHYPRAGQATDATLRGNPRNRRDPNRTVDDFRISLNGQQSATTVIIQADGSGADREEGVATGVPADLDLVLEEVYTAEPGTHVGELHAQARRGHAHYAGHVPIVTVTVRQELTDEYLDQAEPGDTVPADLVGRVHHATGRHRVTARSLDPVTDRPIYSLTPEV